MILRQLITIHLLLVFLLPVHADWCDMQSGTLEQLRNSNPDVVNYYEGDWSNLHVLDISQFNSRATRNVELAGLTLNIMDLPLNKKTITILKRTDRYGESIKEIESVLDSVVVGPVYAIFWDSYEDEIRYFTITDIEGAKVLFIGALISYYNLSEFVNHPPKSGLECVEANYINAETDKLVLVSLYEDVAISSDGLVILTDDPLKKESLRSALNSRGVLVKEIEE